MQVNGIYKFTISTDFSINMKFQILKNWKKSFFLNVIDFLLIISIPHFKSYNKDSRLTLHFNIALTFRFLQLKFVIVYLIK